VVCHAVVSWKDETDSRIETYEQKSKLAPFDEPTPKGASVAVPSHGKAGFGLPRLSFFIAALFPLLKDQIPSASQGEQAEDSGHELEYLFSLSWNWWRLGWAAGRLCRRNKNVYLQCEKQESHSSEAAALNSGKLLKNSFVQISYMFAG